MKFIRLALFSAFSIVPLLVSAQFSGKPLGLGVSLGSPSGISARYFMSDAQSLQGVLGWRGGNDGAVYFQGDFLLHYNEIAPLDFGKLTAFYGGGANMTLADNPGLGLQVTGGLSLFFNEIPVEMSLHISPGIGLIPSTDFRVGSGLSFRYYF